MPADQSVEHLCRCLYLCHWNGLLAPSLAIQSISGMFEALVGLPLCLRRRPPFTDPSRSSLGQGEYSLPYCVTSVVSYIVRLMVGLFVPGNAHMFWGPVDLGFDAVGAVGHSMVVNCSR
jgi:hypothetical protein